MSEIIEKICPECKDSFSPKRKDQAVCATKKCRRDRANTLQNKNNKKKIYSKRNCSSCNQPFQPISSSQKTCTAKACQKLRKNSMRKVGVEKEFNCAICGDESWSTLSTAILCGKITCRKAYQLNFNKNKNYKKKNQIKCRKKAVVSGSFSDDEIEIIFKYRIKNWHLHKIALKLKRTLASVEMKSAKIHKDQTKYKHILAKIHQEIEEVEINRYEKHIKKPISYWNEKVKQCFS